MKNQKIFSLLFMAVLFLGFNSSCSKDDEKSETCSNLPVINGEINVNGSKLRLSVAQFVAAEDIYSFILTSISDDCNETKTLNVTIQTESKLGGTYQISSSSFSGASGSFLTQTVSPLSQSLSELKSGTVKITELGVKKYTIEVDAVDVLGAKTTLSITHQF